MDEYAIRDECDFDCYRNGENSRKCNCYGADGCARSVVFQLDWRFFCSCSIINIAIGHLNISPLPSVNNHGNGNRSNSNSLSNSTLSLNGFRNLAPATHNTRIRILRMGQSGTHSHRNSGLVQQETASDGVKCRCAQRLGFCSRGYG